MEEKEIQKWKSVDVKGYMTLPTMYVPTAENVQKKVFEGDDVDGSLTRLDEEFSKVENRFAEMDLKDLDEGYNVGILREIRENLLPNLKTELERFERLIRAYQNGEEVSPNDIQLAITKAKPLLRRYTTLGEEFRKNPRYSEFRRLGYETREK